MAGFRVPLDAQQRGHAIGRQRLDDRRQVDLIQALAREALDVLRREPLARALADAKARVLGVLQVAQLGRRRELRQVLIGDPALRQCGLQPFRIRPCVVAAAHAAALTEDEELTDARPAEAREELLERPVVDPDRHERRHAEMLAARRWPVAGVPTSGRWEQLQTATARWPCSTRASEG